MTKLDRITYDPEILSGKACIRGMRVAVSFVLKMLASGMTREQILHDHPDLEPEDIDQCLEYAVVLAEERVLPMPAVAS